jgi:hypothetical protein
MKIIIEKNEIEFSFEKYCKLIISVAPKADLVGLSELRLVERYTHPKSDEKSVAHYLQGKNGKNAIVEIHLPNTLSQNISEYYFEKYPEIAALFLSGILFHEIGHHVHQFKRYGVKKNEAEQFADKYSGAGYFLYLKSRKDQILKSYKKGSAILSGWNKEEKAKFKESEIELSKWLEENPKEVPFP